MIRSGVRQRTESCRNASAADHDSGTATLAMTPIPTPITTPLTIPVTNPAATQSMMPTANPNASPIPVPNTSQYFRSLRHELSGVAELVCPTPDSASPPMTVNMNPVTSPSTAPAMSPVSIPISIPDRYPAITLHASPVMIATPDPTPVPIERPSLRRITPQRIDPIRRGSRSSGLNGNHGPNMNPAKNPAPIPTPTAVPATIPNRSPTIIPDINSRSLRGARLGMCHHRRSRVPSWFICTAM